MSAETVPPPTVPGVVDAYSVRCHDWKPGLAHLAIERVDHEPITRWAELEDVKEHHVPGGDVHGVHLFVMTPNQVVNGSEGETSRAPAPIPAPVPAAAPPPVGRVAPRPPRRVGTLNLTRRQVSVLDELVQCATAAEGQLERFRRLIANDDHVDELRAVEPKLERLPHHELQAAEW